ncbi:MAG: type II toxin-antitoxin system PemK/MazF family toxin, partial [Chloroflexota bacterium]
VSDPVTQVGKTLVVVPLTGAENAQPGYDYHVLITKAECPPLDKDSVAKADQLYTIERDDLIDQYYIGRLGAKVMRRLYQQLANSLNFAVAARCQWPSESPRFWPSKVPTLRA